MLTNSIIYNLQAAANPGGRSRLEERLQQNTSSSRRRSNPPQPRASVRAPPRGRGHRLGRAPASTHRALNLSFPNYMGVDLVHFSNQLCLHGTKKTLNCLPLFSLCNREWIFWKV